MDKDKLRIIRKEVLELSQKNMAKLLGVSQGSIARYESGLASPSGEANARLSFLYALLDDKVQSPKVKEILFSNGGVIVLSVVLAMASAMSISKGISSYGKVDISHILSGSAGKSLLNLLKKYNR